MVTIDPTDQRLPRAERLSLKRDIDLLFAEGKGFISYPLRVLYRLTDGEVTGAVAQLLVAVPKKYHRRANKRNRIKRLIREAYRTQKGGWLEQLYPLIEAKGGGAIQLALICVSDKEPSFADVARAVSKALDKIKKNETLSPTLPG